MDEAYKHFHETIVKTDYPLNRFQNIRGLADDTYTAHPTMHLMVWLDVAEEPVILNVHGNEASSSGLNHLSTKSGID